MKRIIYAITVLMIISVSAEAQKNMESQDYKTAAGVKFYPGAITVKHFLDNKSALEGLLYFSNYSTRITGLYELHFDIANAPGLKWYIGPGAHIGFNNKNKYRYASGSSVGIDGVLGLDYKFKGAPLNVSLDWQPAFEFGDGYYNGFSGSWGGLGIRYVF